MSPQLHSFGSVTCKVQEVLEVTQVFLQCGGPRELSTYNLKVESVVEKLLLLDQFRKPINQMVVVEMSGM